MRLSEEYDEVIGILFKGQPTTTESRHEMTPLLNSGHVLQQKPLHDSS